MTDKETNNDKKNVKKNQLMITTQEEQIQDDVNQNTLLDVGLNQTQVTDSTDKEKNKLDFSTLKYRQTPEEKELFKRLSLILSVLVVCIFITLYFISPFSKVGQIILSGVKKSNPEEIVLSSNLKVEKNLWEQYFKKGQSSSLIIKKNPRVEKAKITLDGLNDLKITVVEYPTIGYVKSGSQTFEVLANDKILKESVKEIDEKLPMLVNFKEGESLSEFIEAYKKMDNESKSKVETIESLATKKNPFRIKFKMRDGNEVIGLSTTIADKMAFYDKIASEMKDKGVIDMEAGTSGVFSYPFEKTESTDSSESSDLEQSVPLQ